MARRLAGAKKVARDQAIAATYAAGGQNLGEIAVSFGVSPATVWDACRAYGATRPDPVRGPRFQHAVRDADIQQRYYELGHTLQAIGDVYGIERERVRQIVDKSLKRLPEADRLRRLIARYTALRDEAEAQLAALPAASRPARRVQKRA